MMLTHIEEDKLLYESTNSDVSFIQKHSYRYTHKKCLAKYLDILWSHQVDI